MTAKVIRFPVERVIPNGKKEPLSFDWPTDFSRSGESYWARFIADFVRPERPDPPKGAA